MTLWAIGYLVGVIVVLIVAALLIGILWQARRIFRLAKTASLVVAEIDGNTRAIWSLRTTNKAAEGLRSGAQAIDANTSAILKAVSHGAEKDSAA